MDNKDDEKRRVMTPPAEWASGAIKKTPTDANETEDSAVEAEPNTDELDALLGSSVEDTDWLEEDFSDGISTETALSPAPALAEEEEVPGAIAPQDDEATKASGNTVGETDNGDQDDSWLDLDSALTEAAELLAPVPEREDGWDNDESLDLDAAANARDTDVTELDDAQPSFDPEPVDKDGISPFAPGTTDTSRSHNDHNDSDWIHADSAINQAPPQPDEPSSAAAPAAAELLLTDHAAAPERKFPMWPALLLVTALLLLLVGGWGALSERSALKARIQVLEQANSRTKPAGALDAETEQTLADDNQSLRLQLATMREQYAAMSREVSELQATLLAEGNSQAELTERAEAIVASAATDAAPETAEDEIVEAAVANEETVPSSTSVADTPAQPSVTPIATGGLWFVNLGSYVDRDVAAEAINQFKPMEEGLVIEAGDVKGRTYYRIRAVNFATQSEAQAAAKQYERAFKMKPLWVGKAPATGAKSVNTTEQSASPRVANIDVKSNTSVGGWFIYIDTFARGKDADDRAQLINDAGFEAKVAVEFRQGELFYRVQVVGIESEAQGKEIITELKSLEDMPNLQLRRF